SGEQIDDEGCLSVIGEAGAVRRPYCVKVRAFDRNGNLFEIEGEELLARAFCHEIDHLEGVLFVDKIER
ncbi:MAG: peptide deformylase, partial [Peptostreptococcaceae bacterium]